MVTLDLKDKKLLVALSQNSRASQAQLGKAVGISKSAVPYRIKRLEKAGVIRRFLTIVNFSAIGLTTYNVFFKLRASKEREDNVFQYFDQHPHVIWSCRFLGMWDFHVEIVAQDFAHFNGILSGMLEELGDALDDYRTHIALEVYRVEHLPKEFVNEACVEPFSLPDRSWKENVVLDPIEKKILFSLNKNAVAPLHAIATDCGVSLDIVHYRIKKMYKEGVIIQYLPFVAIEKLGYTEYFCHLELRHLTKEKEKSLKQFLVQHNNVKYAFRGASHLEVLFLLAVHTIDELDQTIRELKQQFGEYLLEVHIHLITEQGNFTMWPKGLVTQ
jgi:Lrp/AsnC family transcriptional regulator, leucine-responsive regulatory protein